MIGGGLLGLEAAWGLRQRGMSVALVHLMPTLMERQLDAAAGQLLQRDLDRRGIAFFTNGQTEEILGVERAEGVQLADGRSIPADLVVIAIGIRPNIDLGARRGPGRQPRHRRRRRYAHQRSGHLRASANASSIAARCSAWWRRSGIRRRSAPRSSPATRPAAFAAKTLSTSLKITGVDVFSAGALDGGGRGRRRDHAARRPARGLYKKIVLRDGKLVGAVLYGDVADGPWYLHLMRDKADVSELRERLVVRPRLRRSGQPPNRPAPDFAAMPDDAQICGCNGVCKGTIVGAISGQKELTSLDGRARPHQGVGLLRPMHRSGRGAARLRGGASTPGRPARPLCDCTDAGHDEVRQAILAQKLKSHAGGDAGAFGWKTPEGCHSAGRR